MAQKHYIAFQSGRKSASLQTVKLWLQDSETKERVNGEVRVLHQPTFPEERAAVSVSAFGFLNPDHASAFADLLRTGAAYGRAMEAGAWEPS